MCDCGWHFGFLTCLTCAPSCAAVTAAAGSVSLRALPWTCVWYTTKYSSFPQLSNSSPWQRLRHMSSFSGSRRGKSWVGKPQWHRSPARTASVFSWNTAAVTHWQHTRACIHTHTHMHPSPSPCTCPHTSPRTCFGWRRWRGEPAWRCPACGNTLWRWRCRLKHTHTHTHKASTEALYSPVLWLLSIIFHQIGLCALTPDEELPPGFSPSLPRPEPANTFNQWLQLHPCSVWLTFNPRPSFWSDA